MDNNLAYDQMLQAANNLSSDQIMTPSMPIGIYTQEAEDLFIWCTKDKEKLMSTGLDESIFEKLNTCAGALRYAQSLWSEEMKSRQEAEQLWKDESPKAFDFRNELVHTFRYAYRKTPALLANIATIAEGDDIPDMIQDLSDLSVLGQSNPDPLTAIGFTEEKLGTAAELSSKMADLRARANGDKYETNEKYDIRNKMYSLLKQHVDEIRDCGKFLFWRDKDRLIGYRSQYTKSMNNKYKNN